MEIKNSINILFSKFNINYRVLLYLFIAMTIVIAIGVSIIIPSFTAVFDSPETSELFTEVRQQLGRFLSGDIPFSDFTAAITTFFDGVTDLWGSTNAPAVFWVTIAVMCVFLRFVTSFCYPVVTDIINSFMSSNMSYGFASNMLKNFKLSMNYAFFHTIFSAITDTLIIFTVTGLIRVFLPFINVFAFAIGLLAAIILIALRLTFSSGVVPEMVVGQENNYFKAVKKSWPRIKKSFQKIFGAYCITTFSVYCLIALLTLPTFGIAFFVFSTVFVVFVQILQLVFYYGGNKMRYYTDSYTIVNTAPIEDRLDLQHELMTHDDN